MMRAVSQRWLETVGGVVNWANDIRYSNDQGRSWSDPLPLYEGTVTEDSTAQVRWSADLTVQATASLETINPFTTWLRVRHGIQYTPGDTELLSLGLYRVEAADPDEDNPAKLKITGKSLEQRLIDAKFQNPRVFAGGPAKDRLEKLITEELPNAAIIWDGVESIWVPKTTEEKERWTMIDGDEDAPSIAKSLGARVFCDGAGTFTVARPGTLQNVPEWEVVDGPGGLLVKSSETFTSENVFNRVVATGESTDGQPSVRGVAEDTDPESPTWIGGAFGTRTTFYTSKNLRNDHQANAVAQSQLAPLLGLKQQVSFDSLHDPRKTVGSVGKVTVAGGTGYRVVVLDSVTHDLLGGETQAQTRTTPTRYTGSYQTALVPEEGTPAA